MHDLATMLKVKGLMMLEQTIQILRIMTNFYNKSREDDFASGCKTIGVRGVDMKSWMHHRKRIRIEQLDLDCSAEHFINKANKFVWERPLPDVKVYLGTHTGCHYNVIASIVMQHTEHTQFFIPIMDNLTSSREEKNLKRMEIFGHTIEFGSSNDPKFIFKMIKACRRSANAKVIIFIDLPRVVSVSSIHTNCKLFNRNGSIISGHIGLITGMKANSCLLSNNYVPRQPDKILCSDVFEYDDQELFEKIKSKMEEQILQSPIDWMYLNKIEFFYHNYKE